ncbi:MAG: hypothetical protein ACRDXE_07465 [Acidimicrobiales bacterium]
MGVKRRATTELVGGPFDGIEVPGDLPYVEVGQPPQERDGVLVASSKALYRRDREGKMRWDHTR